MNGPTKMYHMKPVIVHDFTVDLPKCMYRIKNIHSQRNNADGTEDHVSLPNKKLDIFDQVKQFLKVLYHFLNYTPSPHTFIHF